MILSAFVVGVTVVACLLKVSLSLSLSPPPSPSTAYVPLPLSLSVCACHQCALPEEFNEMLSGKKQTEEKTAKAK